MSNGDKINSLETIKNVLLKEELSQLNQLLEDTGNKEKRLEELTEMIAEAIARRAHKDNAIAASLTPILERSLANAIRKDPKMMADAIFPIIGPAIRRSVIEMVNNLFEQINQAARQNPFNKLRWHIMAKRSGRSYAEVVFSQTLQYQVEQAFLIHSRTGAMLLHASIKDEGNEDADLVSSMLIAINNFVEDSFKSGGIERIKLDDLTLIIKSGPLAYLAVLVRGEVHSEKVNDKLNETIETFHLIHANELANFNGNIDTYKESQYLLQECLMSSSKTVKDKNAVERFKKYSQIVGVILLIAIFIYIPFYLQDKDLHKSQQNYIEQVDNLDGVSVLSSEMKNGNLIVNILTEPDLYTNVEKIDKPEHVILKPHFVKLLKN